jgi:membrane protease YdiL (CAAX protease family)
MDRAHKGSVVTFFVMTYALMWACFITVAVAISIRTPLGIALVLLGAYTPSLVAVWLTARAEGAAGVGALLGRILHWQVGVGWYVFAVGYVAAIKLTAAAIHRLIEGAWPAFGTDPWYLVPLAIAFSTPFQAGEEVGWRGYALPRLTERFGLPLASVLLGIVWAVWHLPQFFIVEADTYGQSFPVFVIQVTALSVAMAWLYARTNGSLLLVMLMHSAVNNSKDIVPSAVSGGTSTFGLSASMVAWITVALLWICALCFLTHMPRWSPRDEVRGVNAA